MDVTFFNLIIMLYRLDLSRLSMETSTFIGSVLYSWRNSIWRDILKAITHLYNCVDESFIVLLKTIGDGSLTLF